MFWRLTHCHLRPWLPVRRGLLSLLVFTLTIVSFGFIVTYYCYHFTGRRPPQHSDDSDPHSTRILHQSPSDNIFVFEQPIGHGAKGERILERCLSRSPPDLDHPELELSAFESCMNVDHPERLTLPYVRMLFGALYLLDFSTLQRVLVIGMGGGSFPKSLETISLQPLDIDIVELDGAVVQVARDWFNFTPSPTTHIYIEDGAEFVSRALPRTYDLIVIDAYDEHGQIPVSITSQECVAHIRRALRPGGVAAINVYNNNETQLNSLRGKLETSGAGPTSAAQIYELRMGESVVLLAVAAGYDGGITNLEVIKRRAQALEAQFDRINIETNWLLHKFISVAQD